MMDERLATLIDDYLQGRSTPAEIREIDALVLADGRFRAALLAAAHDEAAIEDICGAGPPGDVGPSRTGRLRRGLAGAVAGLAAVAAATGWLWLSGLNANAGACHVVEKRGDVLLLARGPGERATPVAVGDMVSTERRIWTCPWGAVSLRLGDGTRLHIDRSSEATLACGMQPKVELLKGSAFLTRDLATGSAVVKTAQASIEVGDGLAAVIAEENRTILEVAEGEAIITVVGGQTARISPGQVAVLENGGLDAIQVRPGRLEWQVTNGRPGIRPAASPGP